MHYPKNILPVVFSFYNSVFETVLHFKQDNKFRTIPITPTNNKMPGISFKSFKPQWGHKKNTAWVDNITGIHPSMCGVNRKII